MRLFHILLIKITAETFKEFVDKLTLPLSSELGIEVNSDDDPEIKELRGVINKMRAKYL